MKFPSFRRMTDDWEIYNAMDPSKKYKYRDVYKNQQLKREDVQKPQTMTSRLIFITIFSIFIVIVSWYVLSAAEMLFTGFGNTIASSSGSSGSSTVVSDTGNTSGQNGVADDYEYDSSGGAGGAGSSGSDASAGGSGSGGVGSGDVDSSNQDDAEPMSMHEFLQASDMEFDTFKERYFTLYSGEGYLHKYVSSLNGGIYEYFDIYEQWEEITKGNYAAYLAMYDGPENHDWKDGNPDNYVSTEPEVQPSESDISGSSSGSSSESSGSGSSSSSSSSKSGGLSIGGVGIWDCVRHVTLWKIFVSLLFGLIVWAVFYPIMKRNLAAQNAGIDNDSLIQYPNDQHIQMPQELQETYDYFPDVGAHAPVQVASMLSHMMLKNKGVKTVLVAKRADSDIISESGDVLYYKGEILLDEDGEPIMEEKPMFDLKFGGELFDAANVLPGKDFRVFYDATKIKYNPGDKNRDKLKGAKLVSDMINKYWTFPEYEPQRPAGAYLVDTAPVNTMVLAITRAGKGNFGPACSATSRSYSLIALNP